MAASEGSPSVIAIEGIELDLPTATASPLAFIVSELLTNSIKYAKGRIIVRLEATSENDYALSVSDDGCGLPEGIRSNGNSRARHETYFRSRQTDRRRIADRPG